MDPASLNANLPAGVDASRRGLRLQSFGSVKRVGAAIGEGAAAVSMIHQRLATTNRAAAAA